MGLEGIVSKRLTAPYRSGPSGDWLKVGKRNDEIPQPGAVPVSRLGQAVCRQQALAPAGRSNRGTRRYFTPGSSESKTSFTANSPGAPKQRSRPSTKHRVRPFGLLLSQIVWVLSSQNSQIQFSARPQHG
jgi:hypothetical protein